MPSLVALVLSTIGTFMAIFGELLEPTQPLTLTGLDLLGIGLSFVFAISMAAYYLFVDQLDDSTPVSGISFLFSISC